MSPSPRLFALIPAAGKSARMGRPKLALPLARRTVLEHVIVAFLAADISDIVVVLAPGGRDLAEVARAGGANALVLEEDTPDMRATIERGLDLMGRIWRPTTADAWLLSPADHPALSPAVIRQLRQVYTTDPQAKLVIPTFNGRRGHPALVSWSL